MTPSLHSTLLWQSLRKHSCPPASEAMAVSTSSSFHLTCSNKSIAWTTAAHVAAAFMLANSAVLIQGDCLVDVVNMDNPSWMGVMHTWKCWCSWLPLLPMWLK